MNFLPHVASIVVALPFSSNDSTTLCAKGARVATGAATAALCAAVLGASGRATPSPVALSNASDMLISIDAASLVSTDVLRTLRDACTGGSELAAAALAVAEAVERGARAAAAAAACASWSLIVRLLWCGGAPMLLGFVCYDTRALPSI